MKLLRSVALIVCLAPLCAPCGLAQAAQPGASVHQGAVAPKVSAKQPAKPQPKAKAKANVSRKPVSKAVAKPMPKVKLDLSLPADMVNDLEPDVGSSATRRKPLLPAMFTEKPHGDDSPFQLNGRLISNEMQLQMRNDSRRDVEGAAIDFEFRQ